MGDLVVYSESRKHNIFKACQEQHDKFKVWIDNTHNHFHNSIKNKKLTNDMDKFLYKIYKRIKVVYPLSY